MKFLNENQNQNGSIVNCAFAPRPCPKHKPNCINWLGPVDPPVTDK